jgi:hypothetical protein
MATSLAFPPQTSGCKHVWNESLFVETTPRCSHAQSIRHSLALSLTTRRLLWMCLSSWQAASYTDCRGFPRSLGNA